MLELLTELGFPNAPPLAGAVEYRNAAGEVATVGVLETYVHDAVQGWQYTRDHLGLFFETAMARGPAGPPEGAAADEAVRELMSSYLEWVRLLGKRTAELHVALASRAGDPVWAPEPFTDFYRLGLYHAMVGRLNRALDQLKSGMPKLPEPTAPGGAGGHGSGTGHPGALPRPRATSGSRPAASAFTAIITWGRCSTPARIS